MNLPKQDRNGARTPSDIERRYKLGTIKRNRQQVEILAQTTSDNTEKVNEANLTIQDIESIVQEMNTEITKEVLKEYYESEV